MNEQFHNWLGQHYVLSEKALAVDVYGVYNHRPVRHAIHVKQPILKIQFNCVTLLVAGDPHLPLNITMVHGTHLTLELHCVWVVSLYRNTLEQN